MLDAEPGAGGRPGGRRAGPARRRRPRRRREPALRDRRASSALDAHALTVGRGGNNDLALDDDEYASARHARFEPRRDGVWVEDVGSTNGTFVNGTTARARRGGCRPATWCASARPSCGTRRRDGARTPQPPSPTPAASAGTTRTPTSSQPPLFAVADGMGGAQAGEIASRLAVAALADDDARGDGEEPSSRSSRRRTAASTSAPRADSARSGMGTTMTRRARRGRHRHDRPRRRLARLPRPRRQAGAADRGPLARRRARPQRQALARRRPSPPAALRDHARARHRPRRRRRHVHDRRRGPGDVFLLCSDGLTSMVGDDGDPRRRRGATAATSTAPRGRWSTPRTSGGGEDNITVVVFEIARGRRGGAGGDGDAAAAADRARAGADEDTLDGLDRGARRSTTHGRSAARSSRPRSPRTPATRRSADGRAAARVLAAVVVLARRRGDRCSLVVVGPRSTTCPVRHRHGLLPARDHAALLPRASSRAAVALG